MEEHPQPPARPAPYAPPIVHAPPEQPWIAPPSTPYGGMTEHGDIPFTLTHKRPVRVTVVAIFCFIFAGFMLLGSLAAAAGSTGVLNVKPPEGVEERSFAFGITTPVAVPVLLHIVYAAIGLVGGIMLIKRKGAAVWLLLGAFVVYTVDQALSVPPALEYIDETVAAGIKQQAELNPDLRKRTDQMQQITSDAMKIGAYVWLVISAGIQITFAALLLSVRRWFAGEAVCKERVFTYGG